MVYQWLSFLQMVALHESADRLSKGEKSNYKNTLNSLRARRERIRDLSMKRREELELSRLFCIFTRDSSEVSQSSITVLTLNY